MFKLRKKCVTKISELTKKNVSKAKLILYCFKLLVCEFSCYVTSSSLYYNMEAQYQCSSLLWDTLIKNPRQNIPTIKSC